LVEHAAVYEAKSGEDVGGSELTRLTDRDGVVSDLALRPEMTPSVTRMVASQYRQLPKPIRWFSIANFYRNERPQRGRNREFWQLNVDMFGPTELPGTIEILQLSMELMRAFNPPADSRSLTLNHRGLINAVL
jgi:histidyl-tRNA synthetase